MDNRYGDFPKILRGWLPELAQAKEVRLRAGQSGPEFAQDSTWLAARTSTGEGGKTWGQSGPEFAQDSTRLAARTSTG
jgi:hypothetical protein